MLSPLSPQVHGSQHTQAAGTHRAHGTAGGSQQQQLLPPLPCATVPGSAHQQGMAGASVAPPRNLEADSNALVTAIRQTIEKQLILSMSSTAEPMVVPHVVHCRITGVSPEAFLHAFPTAKDNKVELSVSGAKVFSPATPNSSALAVHLDGFVTIQHEINSVVMQGEIKLLNDRLEQAADSRSQRVEAGENLQPPSFAAPAIS